MILLLFKLVTTPTLILAATLVSRRYGQAAGGWLVALPLTSGPIAVFLAVEHGAGFSQLAAAGSLEGTAAQACFAAIYAYCADRRRWPQCLLWATVGFACAGLLLARLALPAPALAIVAIGALVAALASVGRSAAMSGVLPAPRWDLPVRMAVATSIVLLVTSLAPLLGPGMSGLAATVPVFAIVLAVFAHRHQGGRAAQSVMRGLLLGLFGFVGFFVTVFLLVTRTGLATAFGLALLVNLVINGASLMLLRERPA